MKSVIETLQEAQEILIDAGTTYATHYLLMVEHMTQLNIDITRITFEKTAALSLSKLLAEQADSE